jgi:hypothetical protein
MAADPIYFDGRLERQSRELEGHERRLRQIDERLEAQDKVQDSQAQQLARLDSKVDGRFWINLSIETITLVLVAINLVVLLIGSRL